MTPRRVNPPLDDRTWIVVPFDNLRKIAEIDWLRGASVNLLYLDMSRWRDIRVIDDERVADLLREVLEASNAEKLDLNAGLAVAKRAGAGRLVMGDLLQLGNRTSVTAKVYDVRTGQRLRSVQEATVVQDSMMPLFGKLARKILNVAPPEGAPLGTIGTTSVEAYQEYLRGIQALNTFNLTDARQRFERALQLDSVFALAHYKLAIVSGWDNPADPGIRTHAEAAARLATALPARERGLINGNLLQGRRNFGASCDAFSALLRADSSDVEAWYGLGDCRFHDGAAEPVAGDTTRIRLRGDINESIRAFRRALELDPTYHLAYQHIVDAYLVELRTGSHCVETRCTNYVAMQVRSGDSLLILPIALPRDTARFAAQRAEYFRTGSRRQNIASAATVAEQWVATSPQEDRAHLAYAGALLLQGRVQEADAQLELARNLGVGVGALNAVSLRIEARAKLWRADAVRLYDSTRASKVTIRSGGTGVPLGAVAALVGPLFGRMAEYDSILTGPQQSPNARAMGRLNNRVLAGILSDSVMRLERAAFDELAATAGPGRATLSVMSTLVFGLRAARSAWPPIDTTVKTALAQPAIALALADTNRLRLAARRLDSLSGAFVGSVTPDTGMALVAADAYLILRDSAAALRLTRRVLDSAIAYTGLSPRTAGFPYAALVPRAMLLRADLAAALGSRDEARLWYKRFLDFWGAADLEFQPLVQRARNSYAALGGT